MQQHLHVQSPPGPSSCWLSSDGSGSRCDSWIERSRLRTMAPAHHQHAAGVESVMAPNPSCRAIEQHTYLQGIDSGSTMAATTSVSFRVRSVPLLLHTSMLRGCMARLAAVSGTAPGCRSRAAALPAR